MARGIDSRKLRVKFLGKVKGSCQATTFNNICGDINVFNSNF